MVRADKVAVLRVEAVTPILDVSSVEESVAWFETLGWAQGFLWQPEGADVAGFGSVRSGHGEIFLCRDGQGSRGGPAPKFTGDDETGGVWMSWWVATTADVDAMHAHALELGYDVSMPPRDEPWGVREFHLRHPDGHTFRVGCGLEI
jgi:hypothetical protein